MRVADRSIAECADHKKKNGAVQQIWYRICAFTDHVLVSEANDSKQRPVRGAFFFNKVYYEGSEGENLELVCWMHRSCL